MEMEKIDDIETSETKNEWKKRHGTEREKILGIYKTNEFCI